MFNNLLIELDLKSLKVVNFLSMFVFGSDVWTNEIAKENNVLYLSKSVLINAHFGPETNYTWTQFDGSPLNYTNWGRKHPTRRTNVILYLQPTGEYEEKRKSE